MGIDVSSSIRFPEGIVLFIHKATVASDSSSVNLCCGHGEKGFGKTQKSMFWCWRGTSEAWKGAFVEPPREKRELSEHHLVQAQVSNGPKGSVTRGGESKLQRWHQLTLERCPGPVDGNPAFCLKMSRARRVGFSTHGAATTSVFTLEYFLV